MDTYYGAVAILNSNRERSEEFAPCYRCLISFQYDE